MIELHVRFKPEGTERIGQTSIMLAPDQEIHLHFEGPFNWVANYDGKEMRIVQKGIQFDPMESDIDFNGIPIVESKSEIVKKIEKYLNDLLD